MKRLRIALEILVSLLLVDIGWTAARNSIHAPMVDVVVIDLVVFGLIALLLWDAWRVGRRLRATESQAPTA